MLAENIMNRPQSNPVSNTGGSTETSMDSAYPFEYLSRPALTRHHQTVRRRLSHGAAQGGHEEYLTASRDDRGTASREFRHHPELGVEHEDVGGSLPTTRADYHTLAAPLAFLLNSPSLRIDLVVFPRTMAGEQMVRMAVFTAKAAI